MSFRHYSDMTKFVRRSTMTFPVNVSRFTEKAYTRGADLLIMDLEDSVPPEEKANARELIKETIPKVAKGGSDVAVRINKPVLQAGWILKHQSGLDLPVSRCLKSSQPTI